MASTQLPLAIDTGKKGEIALSLDDVPMPPTPFESSGLKKTKRIIEQLKRVAAPSVGIFCVGAYIKQPSGVERIQAYEREGHMVANHGYNHLNLDAVGPQQFLADFKQAHGILSKFAGFVPYFRFPYLREGNSSQERAEVMKALKEMGYREGYVTVATHDYRLNQLFLQVVKEGKKVDYDKLRQLYLTIVWDSIKDYQRMAYETLGRDVKHVLLLHENDLASLFIGDLVEYIRSQGWEVIPIEEAYQDPLSQLTITHTKHGKGRIMAVAIEKALLDGGLFNFSPTTAYDYIEKAVIEQGIFVAE